MAAAATPLSPAPSGLQLPLKCRLSQPCSPAVLGHPVDAALLLPDGWTVAVPSNPQGDEGPLLTLDAGANATVTTPWGEVHLGRRVAVEWPGEDTVDDNRSVPEHDDPPLVPCGDPAGCPDLLIDPTLLLTSPRVAEHSFLPGDCNVGEGTVEAGPRRLLRFTTTTPNLGDGMLLLGDPALNPGWFTWGACHGHWHLIDYADYRLWTQEGYREWREARRHHPNSTAEQVLAAYPELAPQKVNGHKQGFCVVDVKQYIPRAVPHFHGCYYQGISPGWADEYSFELDGQWIDVTGVAAGLYVLELEVNAERLFEEESYRNNSGAILVRIPEA